MDTISCESFIKYAKDFTAISKQISDGWEFIENNVDLENNYIRKVVIGQSAHAKDLILKWEYIVYYSSSYGVPVLCFNVWKSNGSLLRLEEVWNHCHLRCNDKQEFYSALTQQENPIFLRPFFTIHPCKTAEILNINNNKCNPIIRYLSAIGPMVNLTLDVRYGMLPSNLISEDK